MNMHTFLDDEQRGVAALYVLSALEAREERAFRLHLITCAACLEEVEALAPLVRELALAAPEATPPPAVWDRVLGRVRSGAQAPDRPGAPARDHDDPRASDQSRAQACDLDGARARRAEGPAHADGVDPSVDREPQRRFLPVWKSWGSAPPEGFVADPARAFHFVGSDAGAWEPTGVEGIEARRLSVDRENDRATFLARMAPGTSYPAHRHAGPEECYVLSGDLRVGDLHMHAGDYQRADPGSIHGVQSTDAGCLLLLVSSLDDEILG
jgi:quercetin dioxygenase-like cupin family protein